MSCAAGVGASTSVGGGPAPLLVGLLSFVLEAAVPLRLSPVLEPPVAGAATSAAGGAGAGAAAAALSAVLDAKLVLEPPVAGAATSAAAAGAGAAAAESGTVTWACGAASVGATCDMECSASSELVSPAFQCPQLSSSDMERPRVNEIKAEQLSSIQLHE